MRISRCVFFAISVHRTFGAFVHPINSSLRVFTFSSSSSLGAQKQLCLPMQPLVVCGPSGVGKGTIISRFMHENNSMPSSDVSLPKFVFSVSHTTRQPRDGEVNGVHYHFCTKEFIQDKIDEGGFFIEHAQVHGNLYGTSFQSIFDASSSHENQQCLLDIDVEGVKSIKKFQDAQQLQLKAADQRSHRQSSERTVSQQSLPELQAKFIFITPPSIDALYERLMGRGSETPESLQRRFSASKAEIEYGTAPGNFDAIIVNDNLEKAHAEFVETVRMIYSS